MPLENLHKLTDQNGPSNGPTDSQYLKKLLETSQGYALEKSSSIHWKETHASFEGFPKKHPNDENILILLINPFDKNKKFYEFPINSIGKIEEVGILTSQNGETAYKIKIWVKKGMPGLLAESFIVE